ncbi:MAG: hypothetical protein KME59_10790 [Trichormus sp. ATA11-4-KO1]|jgi:hypothetical protein|nr:hypothetical protein [Trichormus sp. ATA11-4-KO1]
MASYCEIGQTAKVTLPNGEVLSFNENLPINITCKDEYPDCQLVTVTYKYVQQGSGGTLHSTQRSIIVWSPVGGLRTVPNGIYTNVQMQSRGGFNSCIAYDWYNLVANLTNFVSAEILSVVPYGSTPPQKKLIIKDFLNNELHNALYSNCNYLVECLEGCPPGTLDCGDCCLTCNDVFNEISSIRALVKSLK